LGSNLSHGREDTLTELDTTSHDRDAAIGRDAHPGIEPRVILDHGWDGKLGFGGLCRGQAEADREAGRNGSCADSKAPAVNLDGWINRHGASGSLGGSALNRTYHPLLAAAAAQVVVHVLNDVSFARTGLASQQRSGLHDHAVCTVATLQRLFRNE